MHASSLQIHLSTMISVDSGCRPTLFVRRADFEVFDKRLVESCRSRDMLNWKSLGIIQHAIRPSVYDRKFSVFKVRFIIMASNVRSTMYAKVAKTIAAYGIERSA